MIYHATTKNNGVKIIANHRFRPNLSSFQIYNPNFRRDGQPGTLGYGLYGFCDSLETAREFARRKISTESCILSFEINDDEYTHSTIMDFNNQNIFRRFNEYLVRIVNRNRNIFLRLNDLNYTNVGYQKSLDGALIELFVEFVSVSEDAEINAVMKNTVNDLNPKLSKYNLKTGIFNSLEICIRDTKIIKNDTIKKI